MLKAGLEALARLQLEGYHARPEAAVQQAAQEQAAAPQPGSAEVPVGEQGPPPLHEPPRDVPGKIIQVGEERGPASHCFGCYAALPAGPSLSLINLALFLPSLCST